MGHACASAFTCRVHFTSTKQQKARGTTRTSTDEHTKARKVFTLVPNLPCGSSGGCGRRCCRHARCRVAGARSRRAAGHERWLGARAHA
eukprot:2739496-Prymnesium_polylepis.1